MELPGKSLIKAHHTGGEMDQRSAGAVWDAVGKAGDGLHSLGMAATKMAKDHRDAAIPKAKVVKEDDATGKAPKARGMEEAPETPEERNARVIAKVREADDRYQISQLDKQYDDLERQQEEWITKNPDLTPEQAVEGWTKLSKPMRDRYEPGGSTVLSERSLARIKRGEEASLRRIWVVKAVRAKDEGFANVRKAVENGDEAKLEEGLTGLKDYVKPEELASLRPQVYRKLRLENVRKSIDADPFVMREELAKPDFLKRHPDLTRDDMGSLLSKTDAVARQSVGNTVGAFGNELQGEKLTSKDDVARAYGGSAPAHVVGMMQEQFTKRHDPEQQRLRRTPEYQKQVSGEAGRMLDGLVLAGGVDFEKGYTSASFAISEMDDGPAKNYQTGKLKAALAGVRFRPQGREQSAFAKLDNFISVENGKGKPMVRVRITDPASGAVSYGAPKPFGEVRPELMHAEDEDAAISKQMEADARAGWLYDQLSDHAGMYKNGLEDASDGDVEKILTGLHRELTGRMRDAEKAVPVLPEGVRPAGRNLQEVVGSFYAGRGAAAGQEGASGDADIQLASQLKDARAKVDAAVSGSPHVFNEHERDALASFTQEQGVDRLQQLLDNGKRAKPDIADSMLRYRNKDGRRSQALSRRREEERSLFLLGYGQGGGIVARG